MNIVYDIWETFGVNILWRWMFMGLDIQNVPTLNEVHMFGSPTGIKWSSGTVLELDLSYLG